MAEMKQFHQYLALADPLVNFATKEDIAKSARLLAINVAHYESVYGELPLDEMLAMAFPDCRRYSNSVGYESPLTGNPHRYFRHMLMYYAAESCLTSAGYRRVFHERPHQRRQTS